MNSAKPERPPCRRATAEVPGTHPLMIDLGREDGDEIEIDET